MFAFHMLPQDRQLPWRKKYAGLGKHLFRWSAVFFSGNLKPPLVKTKAHVNWKQLDGKARWEGRCNEAVDLCAKNADQYHVRAQDDVTKEIDALIALATDFAKGLATMAATWPNLPKLPRAPKPVGQEAVAAELAPGHDAREPGFDPECEPDVELELGACQQGRLVPTLANFRRRLLERERLRVQAAVASLTAAASLR